MTDREKEYLGDALLSFLAREYVILSYPKKKTLHNNNDIVTEIICNKNLNKLAKLIDRKELRFNPETIEGKLADLVEIKIFDVFNELGMTGVRRWFYNNIVPNLKFILK